MTKKARQMLSQDPVLARLIDYFGELPVPRARPDFKAMVRIIIGQQLSGVAARTIFSRLEKSLNSAEFNPRAVIELKESEFRKVGISRAKTEYIKGVSDLLLKRPSFLEEVKKMSDLDAFNQLVALKGIGAWSANIFLLFDCGREDIFPLGDASLNKALKVLYQVQPKDIGEFSARWSPCRSAAAMYFWRWADDPI
jgi:DNA-3-methyladenine glycosylase II